MSNFWLIKEKEPVYLRIVKWAQKNDIKVESVTKQQILEVLKMKDN
jgi:hypothetical protein